MDRKTIEPNYKNIIENATEYAIMTTDPGRRIISWNSGAEKMFGWSKEEAIGKLADIIFPDEDTPEDPEKEVSLAQRNGTAEDERWHVRKNGDRFWASGRMMSITNERGEISGYIKILLDQTEKKKMEQKLHSVNESLEKKVENRTEELLDSRNRLHSLLSQLNKTEEREKARLASDLHDNLGQILAVCRMELELLQVDSPECARAEGVKKTRELVDEAIRYAREFMSDLKPPADLNQSDLTEMMQWLSQRKRKYGLTVTIQDDGLAKPLDEEVRRLVFQLVRELLFNVIKHAKVKVATVELSRKNRWVEIRVMDKGVGFDPKLEEPKMKNKGFGIYTIQEQLRFLGGSLKIKSRPGAGTTAIIAVPLNE